MADRRITYGYVPHYFKRISVTNTTFGLVADGYTEDVLVPFTTSGLILINEGTTSSQVVEFSFDGVNIHGELNPSLPSRTLTFNNIGVSKMWARIKSGSSGPVVLFVNAWATY